MLDDKSFADVMIKNFSQNNQGMMALATATANMIDNMFHPSTVLDLGCGCGVYMLAMNLTKHIDCKGVDGNKYQQEFFMKMNPQYANKYILCNLGAYKDDFDYDMITSIEVFEHMPDDAIHRLLDNVKAKKILFSSTPHFDNTKFEQEWGHINCKQHEDWLNLFLQHGYNYTYQPPMPTKWTKLFERIL